MRFELVLNTLFLSGVFASPIEEQPGAIHIDSDYKGQALYHHNVHRSNHSAANVGWDSNLENYARQLAKSCVFEHNTYVELTRNPSLKKKKILPRW